MNIFDILIEKELLHIFPSKKITLTCLEALFDDSFFEVGASGQIYDRDTCIQTVLNRRDEIINSDWKAENFQYQEISKNCYLLNYLLIQDNANRISRRGSIWRKINDELKIIYHQGTIVQNFMS